MPGKTLQGMIVRISYLKQLILINSWRSSTWQLSTQPYRSTCETTGRSIQSLQIIKHYQSISSSIAALGHLSSLNQHEELQRRLAAAEQAEQHYLRLASDLDFQASQISAVGTPAPKKRDKHRDRNKYCFIHGYTSTHTGNECYVMTNPDGGAFTQEMI